MGTLRQIPLKMAHQVFLYFLLVIMSPHAAGDHVGHFHWWASDGPSGGHGHASLAACVEYICRDLGPNCTCTPTSTNTTPSPASFIPIISAYYLYRFRALNGPPGTCAATKEVACYGAYTPFSGNCDLNKQWEANGELQVATSGSGTNCGVTVTVPQAERPCGGNPGSNQVGNPINCASGIKTQTEVDYRSSGPHPLTVKRHYSSFQFNGDGSTSSYLAQAMRLQENEYATRFRYNSSLQVAEISWPDGGHYAFNLANITGSIGSSDRADKGYIQKTDAFTYDYFDITGRRYRFDSNGRLSSIRESDGYTRTLNYTNSTGTLISTISDSFGRTLTYSYSGTLISSIQIPGGGLIRYDYEFFNPAQRRLSSVIYPDDTPATDTDNPRRLYHYENAAFPEALTGITDENGVRFATWSYDSQGRAVSSEHADGAEKVTLNYTSDTETEVRFYRTSSEYHQSTYTHQVLNSQEVITEIETSPCSNCTVGTETRQYASDGYLESYTDANGNITRYIHNARGLETSRTEAYGTPLVRTVATTWHANFDLPTLITETGRTIAFTYSTSGNMLTRTETDTTAIPNISRTTTYTYNSFGQVLTIDGPRTDVNDITEFEYNADGNLILITNALGHETQITDYDPHGNPLTIIDPNGVITELSYDARQRLISRIVVGGTSDETETLFEYDPAGNLVKITRPDGAFLEYGYDNAHRLTGIEDNLGNRIQYTLDLMGNRTAEKIYDPSGALVRSQSAMFNNLGRMIRAIGAGNQTTHFAYDAVGNRTSITDPNTHQTTQAFDALNRLITTIYPAGSSSGAGTRETHYSYDARDNVTSVTDPEDLETTYTYNGFNEVKQQSSLDTGTTTYQYDTTGNRISQTDARGITITYHYDALNRLTRIEYPDPAEDVSYDYDEGLYGIGRLTRITDATGVTEYKYDARGNIVETAYRRVINGKPQSHTVFYQYDGAGRLAQLTYPSGRMVNYTHDSIGRVTSVSAEWEGQNNVLAHAIEYLSFGPVSQLTYGNGLVENRHYDQDYRVTEISIGASSLEYGYDLNSNVEYIEKYPDTAGSEIFDYDSLNRLTEATGPYGLRDYMYDSVGNRLSETDDAQTENYVYHLDSHRLVQRGAVQYQYDASGNTTSNGQYTFAYNQANRLSSVEEGGAPVVDYVYNALGQRVIKQSLAGDIVYIYDNQGRLIAELGPTGNTRVEYAYLYGRPLAQWAATPGAPDPVDLYFTSDDTPPAEAHFQLDTRTLHLTQPDSTQTMVVIDPSDWHDDGASPMRTIAFSGTDSGGIQLNGALFYMNGVPSLHIDRVQFPPRHGDYDLELSAPDTYSGLDSGSGNQATVTILDISTRTLEIAEQGHPTGVYVVAADDWDIQNLGFFQLLTYTIEDGDLIINGGFLINPSIGFGWLQTREGRRQADSYDMTAVLPTLTATYYYHTDHLGTPRTLTDQAQQIVWQANYEPFGKADITVDQITNNLRFPGQYFDSETGLHYNYFRDYDPKTGRYIESDPIGLNGGLNTYSYSMNNPALLIDKLGLDATIDDGFFDGNGRSFLNGPRNGNWGGQNWSGGQNPYLNDGQSGSAPPTDSADKCYMEHDNCYGQCAKDCPYKAEDSDADGYINILENANAGAKGEECRSDCNQQLRNCLKRLPDDPQLWPEPPRPGTEEDSREYKDLAEDYFGN